MILIFIASVISMVLISKQVKDAVVEKQAIDDYEKLHKVEFKKTELPRSFVFVRCTILLILLFVAIYFYMDPLQMGEWIQAWVMSLELVATAIFATDLFLGKWKHRLAYDGNGFLFHQQYFRFSNIKQIDLNKRNGRSRVLMHNGKVLLMNTDQAKQLAAVMKARGK